jgi:hypothetical protein
VRGAATGCARCARGQITAAQWHSVEDFRDDLARADGARLEANEAGIRVAVSPGRYGPTERQIDALTRVRGAVQAVGLAPLGGVLSWVVISGGTISDYAEAKGVRKQRACEMLDACLDHLAEFYTHAGRR